jgi:hypothetical protein
LVKSSPVPYSVIGVCLESILEVTTRGVLRWRLPGVKTPSEPRFESGPGACFTGVDHPYSQKCGLKGGRFLK